MSHHKKLYQKGVFKKLLWDKQYYTKLCDNVFSVTFASLLIYIYEENEYA